MILVGVSHQWYESVCRSLVLLALATKGDSSSDTICATVEFLDNSQGPGPRLEGLVLDQDYVSNLESVAWLEPLGTLGAAGQVGRRPVSPDVSL